MKKDMLLIEGSLRVFSELRELGIRHIQIPEIIVIKEEPVPKYNPPVIQRPVVKPMRNAWEMPEGYTEEDCNLY